MVESISLNWDPTVNEWENKFELLRLYKTMNGNTNVPRSYVTKEGVKLGRWINTQRTSRSHQNRMPPNRISMLDSILFDWDPITNEWKNKFELLRLYKSINGNTNVLYRHATKEGVKLGEWVHMQRSNRYRMSAYRTNMLDSISFDWDPAVSGWESKFKILCQYKSINGNTNVLRNYVTKEGVKLGVWVHMQRSNNNQKSTNQINMLESISFDWNPTVNEWENNFDLLRLYKSINGNTNVPRSYNTKEGVKLGRWVVRQRSNKNQKSANQINKLDSISFDWDPVASKWESKFEILRLYKSTNGNTNVSISYVTKEGVRLGEWVDRQRTNQDRMSTTRIRMLNSISFDWGPTVNEWESKFMQLRLYESMNGNTRVPRSYVTTEGVKLGAWVNIQRNRREQIPTTQINMLNSISFDWDQLLANSWESKFKLLCLYESTNGNTNVPASYVTTEGVKLGSWVRTQRSRQYQMITTRVSMLDSILFDWDPITNEWKNKFEQLRLYKLINGHTNVPKSYVTKEGVRLGDWVLAQRAKKNRIPTTRISTLDSISFDWDPIANEWTNKFELLQQYKSINGNTNVPQSYSTTEGVTLGRWVCKQRILHRKNQLPTTRISMLDSISFEWDIIGDGWKHKFGLLQQYESTNGNTNVLYRHVTKEGVKLGDWVCRQRILLRKNQLPTTRISMLDSVSFDWDPLIRK